MHSRCLAVHVGSAPRTHRRMICCAAQQPGKAWLVGAGIGSSTDHLTCKAARLVAQAEVLVYDDLGAQVHVQAL